MNPKSNSLKAALIPLGVALAMGAGSCGYMGLASRKLNATVTGGIELSQAVTRSASPEICTVVYGRLTADEQCGRSVCVAAIAQPPARSEAVDTYRLNGTGYFSLLLPSGTYRLAAFADFDGDSLFEATECVGSPPSDGLIRVPPAGTGPGVLPAIDLPVACDSPITIAEPIVIRSLGTEMSYQSSYYPPGAIRSLDDEIFSPKYGALGMYDPAAFLRRAGIYFYALEERDMHKIPIVFVHGMAGTPREWEYVVEGIDRDRYDPWFFYYPSGQDIDKLADIFYEIFFSGNIIDLRRRKLGICAHSMGGLVVRAAVNRYARQSDSRFLRVIITLATPYGGSDAAAAGLRTIPFAVPSWRQVAANSPFISALFDTPLPERTAFYLLFGYRGSGMSRSGSANDGTIPLQSLLDPRAQHSATKVFGFNETHTGILTAPEVLAEINRILAAEL